MPGKPFNNRNTFTGDLRHAERRQRAEDIYNAILQSGSLSPEEFTEALGGALGPRMGEFYGGLIVKHGLWEAAIGLASHPDPKIAFRSSWALEKAYASHKKYFADNFSGTFIGQYLKSGNGSVDRSYSKILCDMLRRKLIEPGTETLDKIAVKAFDLLIGPDTKVAVKVWAMEILFDLAGRFAWIDEHLEDVVRGELGKESSTPAMSNHGRKLLRRIGERQDKNK